jgi:hypothetical protein
MASNATADSLFNATSVAIDKDKNSQHAVRWAVDNLASNNSVLVLIHVKHKNHQYRRHPLSFLILEMSAGFWYCFSLIILFYLLRFIQKLLMVRMVMVMMRRISFSLPTVDIAPVKG